MRALSLTRWVVVVLLGGMATLSLLPVNMLLIDRA